MFASSGSSAFQKEVQPSVDPTPVNTQRSSHTQVSFVSPPRKRSRSQVSPVRGPEPSTVPDAHSGDEAETTIDQSDTDNIRAAKEALFLLHPDLLKQSLPLRKPSVAVVRDGVDHHSDLAKRAPPPASSISYWYNEADKDISSQPKLADANSAFQPESTKRSARLYPFGVSDVPLIKALREQRLPPPKYENISKWSTVEAVKKQYSLRKLNFLSSY